MYLLYYGAYYKESDGIAVIFCCWIIKAVYIEWSAVKPKREGESGGFWCWMRQTDLQDLPTTEDWWHFKVVQNQLPEPDYWFENTYLGRFWFSFSWQYRIGNSKIFQGFLGDSQINSWAYKSTFSNNFKSNLEKLLSTK